MRLELTYPRWAWTVEMMLEEDFSLELGFRVDDTRSCFDPLVFRCSCADTLGLVAAVEYGVYQSSGNHRGFELGFRVDGIRSCFGQTVFRCSRN
jgi:hypothetical protein